MPQERRDANSLLNGPQVSPQGKADVVTSQDQVDDLLASLGFRAAAGGPPAAPAIARMDDFLKCGRQGG